MEEELLHSLQSMSFHHVVICHSVCLVSIHHIVYDGPNGARVYPLCGTRMLPVNNNIQVVYMHLTVTVNSIYMYLRLIVNRIYMHSRLIEQHLHAHDAD